MRTGTYQRTAAGVLEVVAMSVATRFHAAMRSAAYWSTWILLEAYGPAEQGEEDDPIQRLKRKHGRPISPDWRSRR